MQPFGVFAMLLCVFVAACSARSDPDATVDVSTERDGAVLDDRVDESRTVDAASSDSDWLDATRDTESDGGTIDGATTADAVATRDVVDGGAGDGGVLTDAMRVRVAAVDASAAERDTAEYRCDGVDDQAEINAALARSRVVELSTGTFTISNTIEGGSNELRGQGRTRTRIEARAGINVVDLHGSSATAGPIAPSPRRGATSITVSTTTASRLRAGDYVVVRSDDLFDGRRGEYRRGEFNRVASIAGTSVMLETPLLDDYTTRPTVVRYQMIRAPVAQGFRAISAGGRVDIVSVTEALDPLISDVEADGAIATQNGIQVNYALRPRILNSHAQDIQDSIDTLMEPMGARGYGFVFRGVVDGLIQDCTGLRNKHSVDLTGQEPPNRNNMIRRVVAREDRRPGLSTHGANYNTTFDHCEVYDSPGGFVIRSQRTTIISPIVRPRLGVGFRFGEPPYADGTWGANEGTSATDVRIVDADVTLPSNGTNFLDVIEPARNFVVTGGRWRNARGHGAWFQGVGSQDARIENVDWDLSSIGAGMRVMRVEPGNGSSPTMTLRFADSFVTLPASYGATTPLVVPMLTTVTVSNVTRR